MAKLTAEEIATMSINRANFVNGNWNIITMTPEKKIYPIRFEGTENDTNEILLAKTHEALLLVEKQVPAVLPTNVERRDIIGLNPNNNA